jgi:hypothetical protein
MFTFGLRHKQHSKVFADDAWGSVLTNGTSSYNWKRSMCGNRQWDDSAFMGMS